MSDVGDIVAHAAEGAAVGLPVYGFVKDVAETVSKACGMDDDDAKIVGIVAGATASITTTIVVGTP
ncbi:MAG TPA: hypothetical protein VGN81_17380 [Pseudonocardiaceae bacterium]|jgi:hypothetical protein